MVSVVDRETGKRQNTERTEQHDRHNQRRDQRRAQVLQEDQQHEEHKYDCLEQRMDNLLNREFDERESCHTDR